MPNALLVYSTAQSTPPPQQRKHTQFISTRIRQRRNRLGIRPALRTQRECSEIGTLKRNVPDADVMRLT
jgi:hypothetical protein